MYRQYSYEDLGWRPKGCRWRMEPGAWLLGFSRARSWIAGSVAALAFVTLVPLQCAVAADPAGFIANVGTQRISALEPMEVPGSKLINSCFGFPFRQVKTHLVRGRQRAETAQR